MTEVCRLPCPHVGCGSSDAFCWNTDKSIGHCKSCGIGYPSKGMSTLGWAKDDYPLVDRRSSGGWTTKEKESVDNYWDSIELIEEDEPEMTTKVTGKAVGDLKVVSQRRRGITEATLKHYGVLVYNDDLSDPTELSDMNPFKETYVYPSGGIKTRYIRDKGFSSDGGVNELWGMNLFAPNSSKTVVVTEGECDTMAAWQMLKTAQYITPVVSVPSASPSAKVWENSKEWLDSFDKIILSVDNDKAGDALAEKMSKMFLGKVYRMNHGKHKDANDFLMAGDGKDFKAAWWGAKKVKPESILSNPDDYVNLFRTSPDFEYFETGIPELDEKMLGICKGYITLIQAKSGLGKCLHPEQGVMMSSGYTKKAKDVVVGDELMGDDSTYRKVLGTTTGQQEMFKVTPVKGDPFICNKSHVLSLEKCGSGDRVDISVEDYLGMPTGFKNTHKLYRSGLIDVFQGHRDLTLKYHPYLVGAYLGDGHKHRSAITLGPKKAKVMADVVRYLEETGNKTRKDQKDTCVELTFTGGDFYHKFMKQFLSGDRRVPDEYLYASSEERKQLLAGLLDTDGSLTGGGVEITQKSKLLSEQVVFLARSLGLAAYLKKKVGKIKSLGFEGEYWRVGISGDLTIIPTRRLEFAPRKQIKDVLHTGFTLESLGVGNYAGFEVDGNHRFLLSDFTVTHNSELMRYFEYQLLTNSDYKVASCRKEETNLRSLLGLVSYDIKQNVTLKKLVEEGGLQEKVEESIQKLTEDERFVTFTIDETQSNDDTMKQLRYMIAAMGVDYIFIEPIQDIVVGSNASEKEGKLSDLITRMGNLCGDTGVGIVVIAHENNDGGAMYSSMITKKAGFKITLSGDRESDDPQERNRTYLEIKEKNRVGLGFGKAGAIDFDIGTYTLEPVVRHEPVTKATKGDF